MTDIEKQALALVNAVMAERGYILWQRLSREGEALSEAICRAIEQHEAFKQEVSDAVEKLNRHWQHYEPTKLDFHARFDRFIIAKPDPLVEAYNEALPETAAVHGKETVQHICAKISAALAARGLEIREVGHE